VATRKATYRALLRDPRWQKKRLEIFQRDQWQCQQCGARHKELQVHHLRYASGAAPVPPWAYPASALVTLCVDCHKAVKKPTRARRTS
jgi:5-methylcytosine-specific restriction endonuclease McrA